MFVRHMGFFTCILLWCTVFSSVTFAQESPSQEDIFEQRMAYYKHFEEISVPWFQIAAVDQYERSIMAVRSDIPKREGITAIQFSKAFWAGELNPYSDDTSPASIGYFGGFGLDGNGDGIADPQQDDDVLHSLVSYLSSFGTTEKDFERALMVYYQKEEAVKQIMTNFRLYENFNTIALDKRHFPLPVKYDYSYKGTWGAKRGWGGRRMHEGTDLFAGYGTQVYSTTYGVVEIMGWNDFGGWRIGIRDHLNTYHYYAHLNGFQKGLAQGDIVEPGTLIGYVGSSGYGKEGTSGKFAPHLHYGMYKFNGRTEWAFDPYPSLLLWERQTKGGK
ncbi:M23 family metallopeptidase [Solibacillus sp. FSL K6-1523]|uniref:M23 family metallopeptidase n=1 Tax=Solibacillus sp. FSL K6-1523 TaxID=2921471 RepID=UPI0030FC8855